MPEFWVTAWAFARSRPTVRLESEQLPNGARIVHCYGHGGS